MVQGDAPAMMIMAGVAGLAEEHEGPQAREAAEFDLGHIDMDVPGLIGDIVERGGQVRMRRLVNVSCETQQVSGPDDTQHPIPGNHPASPGRGGGVAGAI